VHRDTIATTASASCVIPSTARRSEALAQSQLLIVAHLLGALDGAFDL
jgi:hypothetical protein